MIKALCSSALDGLPTRQSKVSVWCSGALYNTMYVINTILPPNNYVPMQPIFITIVLLYGT